MRYYLVLLFLALHFCGYAQTSTTVAKPVCDSPEVKAHFPYGQDSIEHYIKQYGHFRNAGDKTNGKATVVFIVETDGSILNAEILRTSGNKEFDQEAVRVVKTIAGWKPAMNKGEAVRSTDMLSVVYNVR